jgi:hypothetical protein
VGACRRAQGRYRRKENGFNANDLCHYEVSKWEIVLCGDFWKTLDTVKKKETRQEIRKFSIFALHDLFP